LEARDFENFQGMVNKALVLENRRGLMERKHKLMHQHQSGSRSRPCVATSSAGPAFRPVQLQFHSNPKKSLMRQYITKVCSFKPNRCRRGLPPWSSEFMIQTTFNLPIQYSPLCPNCPVRSPIMPQFLIILVNPHRTSIERKGPIMSRFHPLNFY
jgi:hypothetical protein